MPPPQASTRSASAPSRRISAGMLRRCVIQHQTTSVSRSALSQRALLRFSFLSFPPQMNRSSRTAAGPCSRALASLVRATSPMPTPLSTLLASGILSSCLAPFSYALPAPVWASSRAPDRLARTERRDECCSYPPAPISNGPSPFHPLSSCSPGDPQPVRLLLRGCREGHPPLRHPRPRRRAVPPDALRGAAPHPGLEEAGLRRPGPALPGQQAPAARRRLPGERAQLRCLERCCHPLTPRSLLQSCRRRAPPEKAPRSPSTPPPCRAASSTRSASASLTSRPPRSRRSRTPASPCSASLAW